MTRKGLIILLAAGGLILAGGFTFGKGAFIHAKAHMAQWMLERAWDRALKGEERPRAWGWADTWPVARITFPDRSRDYIVLAEGGGEALAFGPALLSASAPLSEPGVSVIAAHRDTQFAVLRDVQPGEPITLTTPDGVSRTYHVTGSEIVRHDHSGIEPRDGGPHRLALVTCYPFGEIRPGPLRYVVWAEPVGISQDRLVAG